MREEGRTEGCVNRVGTGTDTAAGGGGGGREEDGGGGVRGGGSAMLASRRGRDVGTPANSPVLCRGF